MSISMVEVETHLRGAMYPASREELVALAAANGAPDEVVDELRALGPTRFTGPEDVIEQLRASGGLTTHLRDG